MQLLVTSSKDPQLKIFTSPLHLLWEVDGTVKQIEPKRFKNLTAEFPTEQELMGQSTKKYPRPKIYLAATQIPLISNNATTGHKLQGSTIENLYIPSWSYTTNWPYVAISRVTTLEGLFLGRPLDPSKTYKVPEKLARMEEKFRRFKSPKAFDYGLLKQDYDE